MSERDEFEAWTLTQQEYGAEFAFSAWQEGKRRATVEPVAVPLGWYEAESNCRGVPLQSLVTVSGQMTHSGRFHWQAERPETGNPVWPIYAAPQPAVVVPVLTEQDIADLIYQHTGLSHRQFPDEYEESRNLVRAVLLAAAPQPKAARQTYQD